MTFDILKLLNDLRSMLYRAFAHIISDTPHSAILSEAKKVGTGETQNLLLKVFFFFFSPVDSDVTNSIFVFCSSSPY